MRALFTSRSTIPFMIRYPFDGLRAVSSVEPLTMNGNEAVMKLRGRSP